MRLTLYVRDGCPAPAASVGVSLRETQFPLAEREDYTAIARPRGATILPVFRRFRSGLFTIVAKELIISVSGLRGVVGDTLTPEVAFRYAAAFAATLPAGPVLVSRDGRANGPQLVAPVVAGLSQNGMRRVLDAGIAATPTTAVLVRHLRCSGGIQISASHNPAQYNGLKLFSAKGRVVPAATG